MITRSLESAQKKIEGFNFDARKHVLSYDDVLNKQRQVIYERRYRLLRGSHKEINEVMQEVLATHSELEDVLKQKEEAFGTERWYEVLRRLILQMTDTVWVEHLELMDYTRSSVNLRAYGQRDPLIEYRKEANRLFSEMQEAVLERIAELVPNIQVEALNKEEEELRKMRERAKLAGGSQAAGEGVSNNKGQVVREEPKIGRNEMVKITNGSETKELKYKKAEQLLKSGEWKVVAK